MISAFVGLTFVTYLVWHQVVWLITAFFLAVALNPSVEFLAKRLPRRSRVMAAAVVFLFTICLLVFTVATLIPPLVTQTQVLLQDFPRYTDQLTQSNSLAGDFIRTHNLTEWVRANQEQVVSRISSLTGSVADIARTVLTSVAATLTILVLTFFMLLEGPQWVKLFWTMQPPKTRKHRQELAAKMYGAVTGYVNGNLLTSLIAAVSTAIMLSIIRIPFAIPLGIVIGIFDLLPLVGATIGALIVILICLFTSPTAAIIMLLFFIVYQQLENHVLQPVVYSKTIKMSPLLVLASAILGASLGGILGALLAIPFVASLQIVAKDYYRHRFPDSN
jgi:predicted PurR-regulated permease PerM